MVKDDFFFFRSEEPVSGSASLFSHPIPVKIN